MIFKKWALPLLILILLFLIKCKDSPTQATETAPQVTETTPQATKVEVGAPGSAPEQLAPSDTTNGVARRPKFKWKAVDGADAYQLDASHGDQTVIHQRVDEATFTPGKALLGEKTYYWRVRAIDGETNGKWSEIHSFTTTDSISEQLSAPGSAPEQLIPVDKKKAVARKPQFKWKAVDGADAYQLDASHGDQTVIHQRVDEATFTPGKALLGEKTYYWRVRAIDGETNGKWSEIHSFTTTTHEDKDTVPTELQAPKDNAEDRPVNLELQWKEVPGALKYKVQLAHGEQFKSIVIGESVEATSYKVTDLKHHEEYAWRVEPVVPGKETEWSEAYTFTTSSQAISLLSPDDDASNQPVGFSLRWKPLPGISQYQVQVAPGSGFANLVADETTGGTTYKLSGLDNDQTYYWRVQATGDGNSSNWSSARSFHTEVAMGIGSGLSTSQSSDRQALMDLYKATGGEHWNNNSGWGSSASLDSWYGIKTNAQGRVVRLKLYDNNLTGSLPESISKLTKVTYFNVKQNHISGNIPSSIGNMQSLVYLLLNGVSHDPDYYGYHPGKPYDHSSRTNKFTGALPSSIGNLTNLKWLEIAGDGGQDEYNGKFVLHTGITSLPSSLGNLTQLKGLILSFAPITNLPNLGRLTNIKILSLNGCMGLKGQRFPSWVANMTNLRSLWIQFTHFSGSFPDLSGATDLNFLMAANAGFSGDFPGYTIDGTMPDMNMLSFAHCNLTGTLPEFGSSVNLTMFDVVSNSLTGRVPGNLNTQTRMINLGLGWNDFSGNFPSDLSSLHQLRFIYANDNNFTGTLPLLDTSNEALNFLWFQNNQMSGKVPASLARIVNLPRIDNGDLKISDNNFSQSDIQDLINALKAKGKLNILEY